MQVRHLLLGFALVITVVAALYPKQEGQLDVVGVAEHPTKLMDAKSVDNQYTSKSVTQDAPLQVRQWGFESKTVDLFYIKPKVIPAPPPPSRVTPAPVADLTPPPPVAPPLPFTYVGKMVEENKLTIYASKAGRNYILKEADMIEGMYSVKSIDSEKVIFEYLPLQFEQILVIRGAV